MKTPDYGTKNVDELHDEVATTAVKNRKVLREY